MIKTRHFLPDSEIAKAYDVIPHRIGMPRYFYPAVREFMGNIDGKNILDAGCGTGHLLLELSKHSRARLYGADLSKGLLSTARPRLPKSISLCVANLAEPLPIEQTFHIICLTEVIETLKDPRSVIHNLKQHLKIDGEFVITVPNLTAFHPFYKLASPYLPHRINLLLVPWEHTFGNPQPIDTAFEYDEIVDLLNASGLQIIALRGYEYLPYLFNLPIYRRHHLTVDKLLTRKGMHRYALRLFFKCRISQ